MWSKISERILNPLLIFLLSNAFVLVNTFWLIPGCVYVETLLWLGMALLSLRALRATGPLPVFLEKVRTFGILLPFVAFAGLSIAWSISWDISLSRWLTFLFVFVVGGYLGTRYEARKIVEFLTMFGVLILVLGAASVYVPPHFGLMNYHSIQGAWQGVYWHKNHMGLIAAFANTLILVNLIHSLQVERKRVPVWGLLYLFSLYVAYMTDSVASYLTVIGLHGLVLLAVFLLKYGPKIRTRHYLIFGAIAVLASVLLFINLDFFFGLFNRNTSMTGRIPMWGHLFNVYLSVRPWGGYGFNAFWYIESHRVTMKTLAGYPDPIIIADNGFIDILMNTGVIGLSLFLVFYFGAWQRAGKSSLKAKNIFDAFPVLFMAYTLIANVSWSLLFEDETFFMLVMIALLFSVAGKPRVPESELTSAPAQ